MQPMALRRIEMLSGVATLVLGVVLPGFALLFTPYLPGQHLGVGPAFFLAAIPAIIVGVAAWFDSRYYRLDLGTAAAVGGGGGSATSPAGWSVEGGVATASANAILGAFHRGSADCKSAVGSPPKLCQV